MATHQALEDLKDKSRLRQASRDGGNYKSLDEESHLEKTWYEIDMAKKLEPAVGTYRGKDEVQRPRTPAAAFPK